MTIACIILGLIMSVVCYIIYRLDIGLYVAMLSLSCAMAGAFIFMLLFLLPRVLGPLSYIITIPCSIGILWGGSLFMNEECISDMKRSFNWDYWNNLVGGSFVPERKTWKEVIEEPEVEEVVEKKELV